MVNSVVLFIYDMYCVVLMAVVTKVDAVVSIMCPKQKQPGCKKWEANQKQVISDQKLDIK